MVIVNYKTLYECMMQSKAFGICYVLSSCLWATWHDRCDDVRVLCGCAGKLDVIDVISCSCLGKFGRIDLSREVVQDNLVCRRDDVWVVQDVITYVLYGCPRQVGGIAIMMYGLSIVVVQDNLT